MNKLCLERTHTRRKRGAAKARKKILRKMKRLLKRIGGHALRHRNLLEARIAETRFSRVLADQVIRRIDEQLDLLPKVIEEAHDRIIGGLVWRAKGLKHRRLAVGWSVLAHNLTWISRKVRNERLEAQAKAA